MTQLDDQGTRPPRARWAERLAVTGAALALAGIVLAILFAILGRVWSDAPCEETAVFQARSVYGQPHNRPIERVGGIKQPGPEVEI